METHRGLFHLFLLLLVLLLNSKAALSTTKLSCFSVGLLDLPTFGFNQEEKEEGKEAEEKSEVTKKCQILRLRNTTLTGGRRRPPGDQLL